MVQKQGLFWPETIERLKRDHMERRANLGYHLWGLMILFLWMKNWNVQISGQLGLAVNGGSKYLGTTGLLIGLAAAVFFACIVSPPSLWTMSMLFRPRSRETCWTAAIG